MKNTLKLLVVDLMLCAIILLMAFFLTMFKIIDLKVIKDIEINPILDFIGSLFLYNISMFFIYSLALRLFNKKIIIILLINMPIYFISFLIFKDSMITSTIIPFIYIIICNMILYKNKTWKYRLLCIIYSLVSFVIIGIIQVLTGYIKLDGFQMEIYSINFIGASIYSIDVHILSLIVYLIYKEVMNYENLGLVEERNISSESVSISKNEKSSEENLDLSDLSKKQKLIFWCMAMGYQGLQLGTVVAIGFINDTIFELIAMLVTFWIGKKILGKCWHSNKLSICSLITIASFYIMTKITFSFPISLFMCVILSSSFTYGLYLIALKQEKYDDVINDNMRLKKYLDNLKKFDLKTCTKEELINQCRLKKLSKLSTERAIKLFVYPTQTIEEIALFESVEVETIYKAKQRIKNRLS